MSVKYEFSISKKSVLELLSYIVLEYYFGINVYFKVLTFSNFNDYEDKFNPLKLMVINVLVVSDVALFMEVLEIVFVEIEFVVKLEVDTELVVIVPVLFNEFEFNTSVNILSELSICLVTNESVIIS